MKSKLLELDGSAPRSLGREFAVALLLAALICVLRLAMFDWRLMFEFRGVPSHDSLNAAATFASSMHAMYLEGDIAWWQSASPTGGYAQYYNHFFSPIAPTAGHIAFMVWSEIVRLLSFAGIHAPEYMQLLSYNYILAPILTYAAFVLLLRRFCRTWTAPTLAVAAYALGGTAIWNNAWMFYQEWGCLFFFLFAYDLFVRATSVRSFALLALAALIWVASANYWTIFSAWFVLAFVGAHAIFFYPRYAMALGWTREHLRVRSGARVVPAILVVLALVSAGWAVLLGSAYLEQSKILVRGVPPGAFTWEGLYQWAQNVNLGIVIVELFNPSLERSVQAIGANSFAHMARYVGVPLLLLAICFFWTRWRRIDYVLFFVLAFTVMATTTAGFLFILRDITPGLKVVRHLFLFFPYFLGIMLIVVAARAFDRLLLSDDHMQPRALSRFLVVSAAAGGVLLAAVFFQMEYFYRALPAAKDLALVAILMLISAAFLNAIAGGPRRWARVMAVAFVTFAIGDLTHYYWRASTLDQEFTRRHLGIKLVDDKLAPELIKALKSPWKVPQQVTDFTAQLWDNMPLGTSLWPNNGFNASVATNKFDLGLTPEERAKMYPRGAVGLVPSEVAKEQNRDKVYPVENPSLPPHLFTRWTHNGYTLDMDVPTSGLLVTRINYDRNWQVRLDGKRVEPFPVNVKLLAFPIEPGKHTLSLDYRPLARRLYTPLKFLTLAACAFFIYLIVVGSSYDPWRRRRARAP